MKKVLCTIMGAVALLATMTSCSNTVEFEKEEARIKTASHGFCCPTEPINRQLSRAIAGSGYADRLIDVEYIDEWYDIDTDMIDSEYKLIFKDVNGFEKYNKTIHVLDQRTWVYIPMEAIDDSVEI